MIPTATTPLTNKGYAAQPWYQFFSLKAKAAGIIPPRTDVYLYESMGLPSLAWYSFFKELADAASVTSGAPVLIPAKDVPIIRAENNIPVYWYASLQKIDSIL